MAFVCDTCTYPSRSNSGCDNPACVANPTLSEAFKAEMVRRAEEHAEIRRKEEARKRARADLRRRGFTTAF